MLTHVICLHEKQLQNVVFLSSDNNCLEVHLFAFLSFCFHLSFFTISKLIRITESAQNFNTYYEEAIYKFLLKKNYTQYLLLGV